MSDRSARPHRGHARLPRRALLGILTLAAGLRNASREPAAVVAVVAVAMQVALLRHDFSLEYVAANNSRSTPLLFSITGMWSALDGSILLWALVLGGYIAVMVRHVRDRYDDRRLVDEALRGTT